MDDLLTPSKWMEGTGPNSDIVVSSRIRLARNIKGVPFPQLLTEQQLSEVVKDIKKIVGKLAVKNVGKLKFVALDVLSQLDRQILVQKHLISPQLAESNGAKAVILGQEDAISIMVNEEDHLRIQCLLPGLQLHEAWDQANRIDDALEQELDYAFQEQFGYLTSCPTNVGTGLRASVMMHLPALVLTKQAFNILEALSKVGLTVRGLYGEGSQAVGNLFQVSNQITLGQPEAEIIDNLEAVGRQIIEQERTARDLLLQNWRAQLEDRVGRAYGILTNAKIISSEEAIALLSDLRLGIDLKLIDRISGKILNLLLVSIQPAVLQKIYQAAMSPQERDIKRAELIRQRLKE